MVLDIYSAQQANMAIISSSILIRSLSLLHLTVAYYLITAPSVIISQSLVQVLSSSMQLDDASYAFSKPSATTALAGIFLAFIALTDFTSGSLPDELYNIYWATQAPVRLAALFGVAAWVYVFRPAGAVDATRMLYGKGWGDEAKNGVVFTWAFVETMMMFWVGGACKGAQLLFLPANSLTDLHHIEGRKTRIRQAPSYKEQCSRNGHVSVRNAEVTLRLPVDEEL